MEITFHKSLKKEILKPFNKGIDREKFVVENKDGKRVLSKETGEEIRLTDFAGITKGSVVFLKSDIVSLIKYVESKNESAS